MSDNWIALTDEIPDEDDLILVYGHDRFAGNQYGLAYLEIVEVDTEEYTGKFMSAHHSYTEFTWVTHWQEVIPPTQ